MKKVLVLAKTFLPATNSMEIKGLFLAAKHATIPIPEAHLPAGIYTGMVADTLHYLHPYLWKDDKGRHLKMTLACTLINHETGEIEEFGPNTKNKKEFHIREQDCLQLSSGCQFEVLLNEKGFVGQFTILDDQELDVTPTSS